MAEHLDFVQEGVLCQADQLHDRYRDRVYYGLLVNEWNVETKKETFERFALLPCPSEHAWTLIDPNGYPAYMPCAFIGALIGYQLLAHFRNAQLHLHEIGNVLRSMCYTEGNAISWRDKLKNIAGDLLSPKPLYEILTKNST